MNKEKALVVDDTGSKIVLPDGAKLALRAEPELAVPEGLKEKPVPKVPEAILELIVRGVGCVRCHVPVGQVKGSPVRGFTDPFRGYVCGSCLAQTRSRVEVVRTHTGRKYGVLTDPLRTQLLEPVPIEPKTRKRASRAKKAVE